MPAERLLSSGDFDDEEEYYEYLNKVDSRHEYETAWLENLLEESKITPLQVKMLESMHIRPDYEYPFGPYTITQHDRDREFDSLENALQAVLILCDVYDSLGLNNGAILDFEEVGVMEKVEILQKLKEYPLLEVDEYN